MYFGIDDCELFFFFFFIPSNKIKVYESLTVGKQSLALQEKEWWFTRVDSFAIATNNTKFSLWTFIFFTVLQPSLGNCIFNDNLYTVTFMVRYALDQIQEMVGK